MGAIKKLVAEIKSKAARAAEKKKADDLERRRKPLRMKGQRSTRKSLTTAEELALSAGKAKKLGG